MSTASGGIFTTIAEKFIRDGGIVYGASMYNADGDIDPGHIRVTDASGLEFLKGSKYVQCSVRNCFNEAKADLDEGKKVLFSGTPCQIAGLRMFLRKDYPNLSTIDIICHGVPGRKMFMDFLSDQGMKRSGKVTEYIFRDKSRGQGENARLKIKEADKEYEVVTNGKLLSYFGLFLKREIFRDSCYNCLHTSCNRNGDITLGDYWGIYIEHGKEIQEANLTNTKGISCVLVNSDRGAELLDTVIDNVNLMDSSFDKISRHNDQLREAPTHSGMRKEVLEIYKSQGYASVDKYYKKAISWKKYLYQIEFYMPKEIKRTLKTVAHKIKKGN